MKSIKFFKLSVAAFSTMTIISLNSNEPVCHRCEEIREYNAEHHQNFDYYDDYLKSQQNVSTEKQEKK